MKKKTAWHRHWGVISTFNKKKVSFYKAQYPILRIVQSTLHFTSLIDLFTQTPFQLLWEASSHMLQLMRKGCSYTYPPLYIARYSFIQLSELAQYRVKTLAHGFNTAQDSNPGPLSQESRALSPEPKLCAGVTLTTQPDYLTSLLICEISSGNEMSPDNEISPGNEISLRSSVSQQFFITNIKHWSTLKQLKHRLYSQTKQKLQHI